MTRSFFLRQKGNFLAALPLCFLVLLCLSLSATSSCTATGDESNAGLNSSLNASSSIASKGGDHLLLFYNVENLFDTINNPEKLDDTFLPDSVKLWGTQRYNAKLDSLSKVLRKASGNTDPLIIGLCEVENKSVVNDLARRFESQKDQYGICHFESPDFRGIDCALLYDQRKGAFKVLSSQRIRYDFPDEPLTWVRQWKDSLAYTSRDILYVKGKLKGNAKPLHLFVNHWPSRHGGRERSEPRRLRAASVLRQQIDSIQAVEPGAEIIIMGDFNDEPHNKSLTEVLAAGAGGWESGSIYGADFELATGSHLVNLMSVIHDQEGTGSYNYRGNWNTLDQWIVSPALLDDKGDWKISQADVFREDWMMYVHPKFGATPNRSFGGPNYYAGYSDHLPILLRLTAIK